MNYTVPCSGCVLMLTVRSFYSFSRDSRRADGVSCNMKYETLVIVYTNRLDKVPTAPSDHIIYYNSFSGRFDREGNSPKICLDQII